MYTCCKLASCKLHFVRLHFVRLQSAPQASFFHSWLFCPARSPGLMSLGVPCPVLFSTPKQVRHAASGSPRRLALPLLDERPPSLPWLRLARGALPRPTPRRLAPDRRGGDALPPYERLPRSASCRLASPPAAAHARRQGRPAQPPSLPGSPRSRRSAIRSWPASTTQAACLPTQASAGRRGRTSSHRHSKRVEMPAALASGSPPLPSLPQPRPSAPRLILGSAPSRF